MKKTINTNNAPAAIGPYSQAVESDNLLFISGQLGISPVTGEFPNNSIESQTEQVMKNIGAILESAGLNYSNIVKTTIFLINMSDFPKVNEIYKKYFSENFPARSTIQVAGLPKGGLIEIETIAIKK